MSVRSARHYYLHLAIPGWQGRVEEYYDVELRDAMTHATIVALTPAVVVAALTNYVNHAQITAQIIDDLPRPEPSRKALASAPSHSAIRAVGVPLRPTQQARHAARYARKGRKRRKAS